MKWKAGEVGIMLPSVFLSKGLPMIKPMASAYDLPSIPKSGQVEIPSSMRMCFKSISFLEYRYVNQNFKFMYYFHKTVHIKVCTLKCKINR